MVRDYLEEHPQDMEAFVEYFVKENRELAWQMLEGKPFQAADVSTHAEVRYVISLDDTNALLQQSTSDVKQLESLSTLPKQSGTSNVKQLENLSTLHKQSGLLTSSAAESCQIPTSLLAIGQEVLRNDNQ